MRYSRGPGRDSSSRPAVDHRVSKLRPPPPAHPRVARHSPPTSSGSRWTGREARSSPSVSTGAAGITSPGDPGNYRPVPGRRPVLRECRIPPDRGGRSAGTFSAHAARHPFLEAGTPCSRDPRFPVHGMIGRASRRRDQVAAALRAARVGGRLPPGGTSCDFSHPPAVGLCGAEGTAQDPAGPSAAEGGRYRFLAGTVSEGILR